MSFVFIFLGIFLTQLGAGILPQLYEGLPRNAYGAILRFAIIGGIIFILYKFQWLRLSGVTTKMSEWRRNWHRLFLIMLAVGLMSLNNVEWTNLVFTADRILLWLSYTASVGLFEEVLLRGLTLCILVAAWGKTRRGLVAAAIVQAVIFGALHLIGLVNGHAIDVLAQITYATLLGFGFAGLVLYCGSLWPAVVVHFFINALGSLNESFDPNYVDTPASGVLYLIFIAIIFLLTVLPGIWAIKRAPLHPQPV